MADSQKCFLTRAKYEAYRRQLEYMEGKGSMKLAELLASSPGSGMGRPLDLPIHDLAREFRTEVARLQSRLNNAVIIDDYVESLADKQVIDLGATVEIFDIEYNDDVSYTIVGSDEVDPDAGRISYLSPLGSALIGKRQGDKVCLDFNGAEFLVKSVKYLPLDFNHEPVNWEQRLETMKV